MTNPIIIELSRGEREEKKMTEDSKDFVLSREDLINEIYSLKLENERLKTLLDAENERKKADDVGLTLEEYSRYGRQMIATESHGVEGQLKLKRAKVLVIGAGGLGSPVLPYLAAAGVGTIGIVDDDKVEISNLHRQILHNSFNVGMYKCDSAKHFLNKLNPNVRVFTYPVRLSPNNAFSIFEEYNYILDCTDNLTSRYLISDVAVILGKTLVTGSGVGTHGQLAIFNFQNYGPCYRCYYPVPVDPMSVTTCDESGVIGPCIGLVGVMMAVETMKLILGVYNKSNFKPTLKLYSGFPEQTLRSFKMRGRQEDCECCGKNPSISRWAIESGKIDYVEFCGRRNYNVCRPEERISVQEFYNDYKDRDDSSYIFLDVRPRHQYNISHLSHSYNVPLKELIEMNGNIRKLQDLIPTLDTKSEVVVICRRGNDSQLATRILRDDFHLEDVKDIKGGLFEYIDTIDPSIPKY